MKVKLQENSSPIFKISILIVVSLFLYAIWRLPISSTPSTSSLQQQVPFEQPAIIVDPSTLTYEEWWIRIQKLCGDLCDYRDIKSGPGHISIPDLIARKRMKRVDCDVLFSEEAEIVFEGKRKEWPPPKYIPVQHAYTLDDLMQVTHEFHEQLYSGGDVVKWKKDVMEKDMKEISKGTGYGTYGPTQTNNLLKFLRDGDLIRGKNVLVVGSEKPWVEEICLILGAASVTTQEYAKIESEDNRLITRTPKEMNDLYRSKKLDKFDVAVHFSSLEHSGLMRYGDGFNPMGDIIQAAKLTCLVKQGGNIVSAMPSGVDRLVWNSHRMYGMVRWPLFLTNMRATKIGEVGDYHQIVLAVNERE